MLIVLSLYLHIVSSCYSSTMYTLSRVMSHSLGGHTLALKVLLLKIVMSPLTLTKGLPTQTYYKESICGKTQIKKTDDFSLK